MAKLDQNTINKLMQKTKDVSLTRPERRRAKAELENYMRKAPQVKTDEEKKTIHVIMKDGTTIELYRSIGHLKELRRRNEPIRIVLQGELTPHGTSRFKKIWLRIQRWWHWRRKGMKSSNERGFEVHWEDIADFYYTNKTNERYR